MRSPIDDLIGLRDKCSQYGLHCLSQLDREEKIAAYVIFMVLWYLARKIQYQYYAWRLYPDMDARQLTFYGIWPLEFRKIRFSDLRRRYIHYLIEVNLLLIGLGVMLFAPI